MLNLLFVAVALCESDEVVVYAPEGGADEDAFNYSIYLLNKAFDDFISSVNESFNLISNTLDSMIASTERMIAINQQMIDDLNKSLNKHNKHDKHIDLLMDILIFDEILLSVIQFCCVVRWIINFYNKNFGSLQFDDMFDSLDDISF